MKTPRVVLTTLLLAAVLCGCVLVLRAALPKIHIGPDIADTADTATSADYCSFDPYFVRQNHFTKIVAVSSASTASLK